MIKHALNTSLMGALLALLGCSSSPDIAGTTVATTITEGMKSIGRPPAEGVTENWTGNALYARVAGTNRSSELRLVSRNGNNETWEAADNSALVLTSGVIASTFGLGHDMYSADVADLLQLIKARQNGSSERIHRYLDGENQVFLRAYRCTVRFEAAKSKELAEISENCQGIDAGFTNLYVLDRANDLIGSSRQWIGPNVGYIEIEAINTRAVAQDRVIEAVPVSVYDLTKNGG